MFDSFDFDHNGTIDATELDSVMAHYRLNVSTHILDQIVMKYGESSSRSLTFAIVIYEPPIS
jgi:Ca2+-binding EF-hand superfamily protein